MLVIGDLSILVLGILVLGDLVLIIIILEEDKEDWLLEEIFKEELLLEEGDNRVFK
jgi:hypothetical protein